MHFICTWCPHLWLRLLEFYEDIWQYKRVPGLLYSNCLHNPMFSHFGNILMVCQTDGQTQGQSTYCVSIASHGKICRVCMSGTKTARQWYASINLKAIKPCSFKNCWCLCIREGLCTDTDLFLYATRMHQDTVDLSNFSDFSFVFWHC